LTKKKKKRLSLNPFLIFLKKMNEKNEIVSKSSIENSPQNKEILHRIWELIKSHRGVIGAAIAGGTLSVVISQAIPVDVPLAWVGTLGTFGSVDFLKAFIGE
jgi:uncharacterized membrane protein YraQ (UPF0718 family)